MKIDQQWLSWAKHFDVAENEVFGVFYSRSIWRALSHVLDTSKVEQYPVVRNYYLRTYVSTACSAIRREADTDTRTSSLARALLRLVESPKIVSRERFVTNYVIRFGAESEAMANNSFNSFAPNGGDAVESSVLQLGLSRLTDAAASVKAYTDTTIAHRQRPGLETETITLSFDQLDHAINELGEITKQLHLLRNPGESLAQVGPVLDRTFLNMFKVAWLAPGFTLPPEHDLGGQSSMAAQWRAYK